MNFRNIYEAKEWFLKYIPLKNKAINFCYDYPETKYKWKFGDWILIQHIQHSTNNEMVISRPILAIFTGYTIWDQAWVINFVQQKRAWMNSHQVKTNPELEYYWFVSGLDYEVETIQFWTDNMHVIAHWKHKPTISELKHALTTNKLE